MKTYKAARSAEITAREREHRALVRHLAPQGMVLLENTGALPFSAPKPIALYGAGARNTVKGGTGSGDVNTREIVSIDRGLREAGFTVVTDGWLDEFDRLYAEARKAHTELLQSKIAEGMHPVAAYFNFPFRDPETPEIRPDNRTDTALYVLSRNSGEGKDRLAAPGDYLLSESEKRDLLALCNGYKETVLLLNVGGVMDLSFLQTLPKPVSVLLVSQSGADTGYAVADALLGVTAPSGRLTDTWACSYGDYPSSATFGANDGNLETEPYREGIYVGYRYFDTFGKPVRYPFGYGLGYTEFTSEAHFTEADAYGISGRVRVKNTGSRPGREVVQVYVSAPAGDLEKPFQVLAAFAKTRLLEPGEQQSIDITFALRNIASYDEAAAAWVLEPGLYKIRVGRHSRDTHVAATVEVRERTVLEQLSNLLRPVKPLTVLSAKGAVPISLSGDAEETAAAPHLVLDTSALEPRVCPNRGEDVFDVQAPAEPVTMADLLSGARTPEEMAAQLKPEELAALCVGDFGSQSVIGNAGKDAPGAAGQTTRILEASRGVGSLVLADGPAGVRLTPHFRTDAEGSLMESGALFALGGGEDPLAGETPAGCTDYYQYCTAIPIATQIAQSWDLELAETLGRMVGREMALFGVHSWLAPGMNLHRNPLCGRNFEYYSEDPLIAGLFAAADTKGVQSTPGVGTTPKHFACNNQEDNRNYSDSVVCEQALRELFLRSFEICVRTAQPMFIMTSYNFLNGTHSANNRDLLTHLLRGEWNFAGVVMTDWGTTGGGSLMPALGADSVPALCIAAGNDLIEPGNEGDTSNIVASVTGKTDTPLSEASLRLCASRVLRVIAASSLYPDAKPWTAGKALDWVLVTK